ncbi:MAG: AAA family ATPase [Magnetococcales bacterium]|nr:AAA family ATPase [Magnetococcales bacterium]
MRIRSLRCARYKAFNDPVEVEIRPLTLFFGRNNSGKSAILRLIPLLLHTLSGRSPNQFPLKLDGHSYGATFPDLIHGRFPDGNVEFGMTVVSSEGLLDLKKVEIQHIRRTSFGLQENMDYTVVSRFHLLMDGQRFDWNWVPGHGKVAKYQTIGQVPFRGMLPDPEHGEAAGEYRSLFSEWRERFGRYEEKIEHLGPLRAPIQRFYDHFQTVQPLGFHGSGAISRLIGDQDLQERVSSWFEKHMEGWRFSLSSSGAVAEPSLSRGGVGINMAMAGEGMQHVLPVVTQQLERQISTQDGFLDLLEEPEMHLHPAAHAPLGDLLMATAKTGRGQVVVETHSENLLLRIRRRIAEGNMDPDDVGLYWVEDLPEGGSRVKQIPIDSDGEVAWWPERVFSEGYQEVRAMRGAVHRRKGS